MREPAPKMIDRIGSFHNDDTENQKGDDIESISVSSTESKQTTGDYEEKEDIQIATKESRYVFYTRVIVLLVLIGVATAVSVMVFLNAKGQEHDAFLGHFHEIASKLALEFQGSAFRCIEASESLSNEITAYALSSNRKFPNVALPEFERRVKYSMELSDVKSVTFFPIVNESERASWEHFSVANQGWLVNGLDVQNASLVHLEQSNIDILEGIWGESPNMTIPETITTLGPNGSIPDTGPGPYAPLWQFAPAFPVPSIVNYNALSHHSWGESIHSVVTYHEPLLTGVLDHSDLDNPQLAGQRAILELFIEHAGGGNNTDYQHGPTSILYAPVFENYDKNPAVVGVLASYLDWLDFFEKVLLEDDVGIFVVLWNTCNQTFTFRLDGYEATYLGPGDRHESAYSPYKASIDLGAFVEVQSEKAKAHLPEGHCLYHADVYPSAVFQASRMTNEPKIFAVILACTFVFTCSVFLLYDYLVERRQRLVLQTAVRSETVVASLFPKGVRDRLYANKEEDDSPDKKPNAKHSFLASNHTPLAKLGDSANGLEDGCKAIADLYPNCTVLFMDVVGFTKWSSSREPWQVFRLLETMYRVFDKTAKREAVFKVETIGDCYVAVTGIPYPQAEHAVIMARFAAECNLRVGRILHRLVGTLGPDTVDLQLRTGLHSGPVIAGVLRGAKARFQLFGDTVNTAARMESTGAPSRIQISTQTADLLVAAGKSDWISKREDEVLAKGKGNLQTYWLKIKNIDCSKAGSAAGGSDENLRSSQHRSL